MEKIKIGRMEFERTFEKIKANPKIILINILCFAFSFVLSHASIMSTVAPFGLALCGVVPSNFVVSTFLGAIFGYASAQTIAGTIRYIALIFLLRILFIKISQKQSEYQNVWFVPPACVFSALFVSGIILNVFISMNIEVFMNIFCESAVGAISVYFLDKAFSLFEEKKEIFKIRVRDFVCLIFSFGIFIISFSCFNFFEISLSKILVGLLVLVSAFSFNELAGSICGIVGGISIGIYTSSVFDIISFSVSGLLSGVFSPLGKSGCIVSYVLCRFATFFFSSQSTGLFALSMECAISIVLFLAIPNEVFMNIKELFVFTASENNVPNPRREIVQKISGASQCIDEITDSIGKISESLRKVSDSSSKSIYCKVQGDVCKSCKKHDVCWDKHFSQTYKLLEENERVFRENETVEINMLPKRFLNLCAMPEEFFKSFEKYFRQNKAQREEEIHVANMRNIFYDQLNSMSQMLKNFSNDFSKEKTFDFTTASKIKSLLKNYGVNVRNVNCIVDERGVMKVEAICKNIDKDLDKSKITQEIEKMTLRKFERPVISFPESGITITFMQKPWISIDVGVVQYPSTNASLCGDYFENFCDNGTENLIISDGMGTGGRAAVDSAMTAEFFSKLLKNGFGEDCALKLVNSSMLVKSSYESLSTIDSAKIDLFTGKTEFNKAGATLSFVRKNRKCKIIEGASLPVGILREIEFSRESICLSPGDIIVMVSDGVTAFGTEWIENEIENYLRNDAENLARKIAMKAVEKSMKTTQDDITVVVGILS